MLGAGGGPQAQQLTQPGYEAERKTMKQELNERKAKLTRDLESVDAVLTALEDPKTEEAIERMFSILRGGY